MFAVIKSGGRQYKVSVGQTLEVNRLPTEDGEQIAFDEVLLISDEDRVLIGTPLVENAVVLATAVKQGRGEKLIVFRYKAKKRIRHRKGHRQELTILSIDDIVADGKSLITGEAPKAKETPAEDDDLDASSATSEIASEANAEQKPTRRRRAKQAAQADDSESNTEE